MAGQKMRPVFYALHAATLNPYTSTEELATRLRDADALQERHRLSEGAVYTSACRRYLLETGDDWKSLQQTPTMTQWGGESDHRYRAPRADDPSGFARCSCGEKHVPGPRTMGGAEWHTKHLRDVADRAAAQ